MAKRLPDSGYVAFPFRIEAGGAALAGRAAHVRQQIEQVLFTNPGERVFRPDFGVGVARLVFEPSAPGLWSATRKRLEASLSDALAGEVDPRSLEVELAPDPDAPERLHIRVAYALARIGQSESHDFTAGPEGVRHG